MAQAVIDENHSIRHSDIKFNQGFHGKLSAVVQAVLCANSKCQKTTIDISVYPAKIDRTGYVVDYTREPLFAERVLPRGAAKPQPEFIPKVLVQDYVEACLIQELSPKASATLSRRCLQGMIRDFANISERRLIDEIAALRKAVENGTAPRAITIESVDAIDHVRGIGNIGAHFEKDINVIVDVDPSEAGILISLVEMLFKEWYVEQHNREIRLSSILKLKDSKADQIAAARQAAAESKGEAAN